MTSAEQMNALTKAMKEEKKRLNGLPKEEAKKEAKQWLIKIGIINEEGNINSPYVGAFSHAE